LVWLDLLYDFAMLTEDDQLLDGEALREPLIQLIEDLESSGQGGGLECLLARSTLAQWHLRAGDAASATLDLDEIRRRWQGIVPARDSFWIRHRAMTAIAVGIGAAEA